jgi:ribose transport system substrate-binding protein
MTTYERRQAILKILEQQSSAKVTDLAQLFGVAEGTIRNDLVALEQEGRLLRVWGGAVGVGTYPAINQTMAARLRVNADAKQRIARWAAGMVESGDAILLDASTTVLYMAQFLKDRNHLTVVTNGIEIAQLMAANPTNTVILPGGVLSSKTHALIGGMGERVLRDLHIRTAFMSCAGFSLESGFMETELQEAEMKSHMLHSAQRRVMLVDVSKWGKLGLTPFATIQDIDYLATDHLMPLEVIEHLRGTNTHVIVCGENTISSYTPYDPNTQVFKIGFANMSEDSPFGRDVRRGLERAAQDSHQIEMILADNRLNPQVALQVADDLIRQRVDLMIEFQIDENMNNRIAYQLKQASIPVIAVDIPMVGATFFGVDNYAAGHLAGLALGEAVQREWGGDYDRLIVLEHPRTGHLPAARIQGQLDGFREVLGSVREDAIIRRDCRNTTEVSYQECLSVLQELPTARHLPIISFNDDAALGALQAARDLQREEDVLIVGQGADRVLRAELRKPHSRIVGSTAFKPERYGEKLIEIALKILNGEPVPPAVFMDHTFITAQNIDLYYPLDDDER